MMFSSKKDKKYVEPSLRSDYSIKDFDPESEESEIFDRSYLKDKDKAMSDREWKESYLGQGVIIE